jgi:REP element-mobilizing transposase RayT
MREYKIHKNRAYHVVNRGVSKRKIFKNDADYKYFMFRIAYYKRKYKIKIVIFCIMPNHYHFLFDVGNEPSNIGNFMKTDMLAMFSKENINEDQ